MQFVSQEAQRLDVFLSNSLNFSRNQISILIKEGNVQVDEKVTQKAGFKLNIGQKVKLNLPKPKFKEQVKVDFDISIIYEDDEILIINKPPFITVHQAPSVKEATVVDWLRTKGVRLSSIAGKERQGIVHRIDKETSGALVVAKTNEAHQNLSKQLESKSMGRYYLALIDLELKENIIINKPIARNPKNRLKMAVIENAKPAKTAFLKLESSQNSNYELIAAKLYSGRTHQIRVHLNSLSRHILGDILYGFKSQKVKIPRVMLHATFLYLIHPKSGENLLVKAPFFDDFQFLLNKYFSKESVDEKINSSYIISSFESLHRRLF